MPMPNSEYNFPDYAFHRNREFRKYRFVRKGNFLRIDLSIYNGTFHFLEYGAKLEIVFVSRTSLEAAINL